MFEKCKSLGELNATRIKAIQEGADIVDVNNQFNAAREKIVAAANAVGVRLTPITVKPREVRQYCGIAVCGRSDEVGVIKLTDRGFLY